MLHFRYQTTDQPSSNHGNPQQPHYQNTERPYSLKDDNGLQHKQVVKFQKLFHADIDFFHYHHITIILFSRFQNKSFKIR